MIVVCQLQQMSKILLILVILICSQITICKLMTGLQLILTNTTQITIRTMFKYSDVDVSRKTIKMVNNLSTPNRIEDIPNIPIKYEGRVGSKYYRIDDQVSAYVLKSTIYQSQLHEWFEQHNGKGIDFYLLPNNKKDLLDNRIKSNNKSICFYDEDNGKVHRQIHAVLDDCFKEFRIDGEKKLNTSQKNKNSQNNLQIYLLVSFASFLLCSVFTFTKRYLFENINKKNSVI